MIADALAAVQGEEVFKWLLSAGFVLFLYNEGKKAFSGRDVVTKQEFEKNEKYMHESFHGLRNDVNGLSVKGQNRDEILATLEERSKTQGRQLDRIEGLLRNKGRQANDIP